MTRKLTVSILAALSLSASFSMNPGGMAFAATAPVPASITAALADKARPEADTKRDALRRPGEMLAFTGVKPGAKVVDFMMGAGYFTRILSAAVGPKGKVTAYQAGEFIKMRPAYTTEQTTAVAGYANVTPTNGSLADIGLPDKQDLVFTVQNYHDLHLKNFPADTADKVNAQIFKSLKPGGVYLVADHVAAPGGVTTDIASKLHRIDPAVVKKEVEAAGFKLESESKLLANPDDDHSKLVFDPTLRGKTDQFILKFRKPK